MRRFKHDALLPLLAAETVVTGRATAGGGIDGDTVPPQHTLLLMPAVTDGSLQDVCDDVTNSRGRLPAAVLLSLCAQAASGLACMHAHSPPYAHRDVKPGNLLLQGWRPLQVPFASDVARSPAASTWSVRAMLCDFGSTRPARHAGEGGRPAARCLVEAAAAEQRLSVRAEALSAKGEEADVVKWQRALARELDKVDRVRGGSNSPSRCWERAQ